jgi:prepilin-type N-terminal cleavage/methylation domain-containing protein
VRLRNSDKTLQNEGGFSLSELLVVIVIIAILAAFAIPTFLNQRSRSYITVARTDARSISNALQDGLLSLTNYGNGVSWTYTAGTPGTLSINPSVAPLTAITESINLSPGSSLAPGGSNNTATNSFTYCIAVNNNGHIAYQTAGGAVTSCEANATLIDVKGATADATLKQYTTLPTFLPGSGLSAADWKPAVLGKAGWVTIAAGTNKAAVSSDGATWVANTNLPTSDVWQDITYGAGLYVAVGTAGAATTYATSPNGSVWTAMATLPSGIYKGIAYGGSKFIAVGTNVAASSVDGLTWTALTIPAGTWSNIIRGGNGAWVAINSVSSNLIAYSADGVTWSTQTLPSTQTWNKVCYGGGKFIAVASSATANAAVSYDGITWSTTALPSGVSYGGVAYTNGVYTAVVSGTTTAYTSLDGNTWTSQAMSSSATWNGLTAISGVWVLMSNSATSLVGV